MLYSADPGLSYLIVPSCYQLRIDMLTARRHAEHGVKTHFKKTGSWIGLEAEKDKVELEGIAE